MQEADDSRAAELDAQYNLRVRHPDHSAIFASWAERSARARECLAHRELDEMAHVRGALFGILASMVGVSAM